MLFLSIITMAVAGVILLAAPISARSTAVYLGFMALAVIGMNVFYDGMYAQILERFHYKTSYGADRNYKYSVQNRTGIIAVERDVSDIIYGGGVYDGRFNIDPVLNANDIQRAYMIAALHPNPREVLEIGLSSGSWTRVISNHPGVKKLTVVDINPGYVEIIERYREISGILRDPKVAVYFDDGRRWLNRHPEAKFDLIVSNTTFHWRSFSTNLLSEEFLQICKTHLKPGGVLYYNATFSEDVAYTGAMVFNHLVSYKNFIAVSDSPFVMTPVERRDNLSKFANDGRSVFKQDSLILQKVLSDLSKTVMSDRAEEIRALPHLLRITDDNMVTEYKRINNQKSLNRFYNPERTWSNLFKKYSTYWTQ